MSSPITDRSRLEKAEHTLFSGILYGVEGRQIELQARFFSSPKPPPSWIIEITGMARGAIQEVTGRIAGAFAKYGLSPCPRCGKLVLRPRCDCRPAQVQSYRKKISGPILDRIDLNVEVRSLSVDEKFAQRDGPTSKVLREKIHATRARQRTRFGENRITCNATIPGGEIHKWCQFDPSAFDRYKRAIADGSFSTRATDRMAKVARTVADLEGADMIGQSHVEESAAFISGSPLG